MPTDKDDIGVTSLAITTAEGNQELIALFTSSTSKAIKP